MPSIRRGWTAMQPCPSREGKIHRNSGTGCQGFLEGLKLCAEDGTESAAFVVHGGIIMAVLERFADRKKAFYEWHVGNGEGYEAEADPGSVERGIRTAAGAACVKSDTNDKTTVV